MANESAPSSPPSSQCDIISTTIPAPPPLLTRLELEDFTFQGQRLPAVPPAIVGSMSDWDLTLSIMWTILNSTENDKAIFFMLHHRVVHRLFKPREVMRAGVMVEADWSIRLARHANAMVYYLLDPGLDRGECAACQSRQGRGPFRECLVPRGANVGSACTNCIFMGHGATCSHQRLVVTRDRLWVPATRRTLTPDDLRFAATDTLKRLETRFLTELARREREGEVMPPINNSRWNSGERP